MFDENLKMLFIFLLAIIYYELYDILMVVLCIIVTANKIHPQFEMSVYIINFNKFNILKSNSFIYVLNHFSIICSY